MRLQSSQNRASTGEAKEEEPNPQVERAPATLSAWTVKNTRRIKRLTTCTPLRLDPYLTGRGFQ
jgi:hypothetical protein